MGNTRGGERMPHVPTYNVDCLFREEELVRCVVDFFFVEEAQREEEKRKRKN